MVEKALDDPSMSRLLFYRKIKSEFGMEHYLKIPGFQQRRHISKLSCSDHAFEIEKGRYKKGNTRTLANERICTLCNNGQVEDEEYFLLKCDAYKSLRTKHKFEHFTEVLAFFNEENLSTFEHFTEVLAFFNEENLSTFEHFTEVLAFFNEENLSTFEHFTEVLAFFNEENLSTFAKYLIEAFKTREQIIKNE